MLLKRAFVCAFSQNDADSVKKFELFYKEKRILHFFAELNKYRLEKLFSGHIERIKNPPVGRADSEGRCFYAL